MQMMQDITRNVLVMVGSIVIALVVVVSIVVILFFLLKAQFTPDKVATFLFG